MAEELAKIDTEVKVTEPKAPTSGRMSFADVMGVSKPFLQQRGQLTEELKKTEGEILTAKQAQKETAAEGKMAIEQRTAEQVRGAQGQLQQKMQAEPLPAFIPTQDNFRDIAGLFSLIGVMGMIAGKSNSVAAMNAMNGMLEGYRSGRNDLYRREREVFDKNFKTMLQKHAEFRKEMEDAVKLAQTDRQAGLQAAELAAVKAGSEIVKAEAKRGDLLGLIKRSEEMQAASMKALEINNTNLNAERAAAERAAQAARAEEQRNRQLIQTAGGLRVADLSQVPQATAEELASATPFRGGGQPKQIAEAQVVKIEGLKSIGDSLEKLKADFKPSYAGLGVFGVGADLQIEAARRGIGEKEAQDAARWWARYQRLQAPNRHALFGATLTGNELKNYQSFTTKPSDSAEYVINNLTDQINYSKDLYNTRLSTFESMGYKIPSAKPREFDATFSGGAATGAQSGASINVGDERQRANDAIARGANREAVAARFKQKTGEEL